MGYNNIDINSDVFKNLSDRQKLRVVKCKLDDIFNCTGSKSTTVIYKGSKKMINKDDYGIFKDLVEREKALEKKVTVKPLYNILITSNEYEKLSIDEKIDVLESKLDCFFTAKNKVRYKNEQLVSVIYKGTTKFIPYSLYGATDKLICMIAVLEKQKKNDVKRITQSSSSIEKDIKYYYTACVIDDNNFCSEEVIKPENQMLMVSLNNNSVKREKAKERNTALAIKGTTALEKIDTKIGEKEEFADILFNYIDKFLDKCFVKIRSIGVNTYNKTKEYFTKKKDKNKDKSKKGLLVTTGALLGGLCVKVKNKSISLFNKVSNGVVNTYNRIKKYIICKKDEFNSVEFINKNRINKRRAAALICSFVLVGCLLSLKGSNKNKNTDSSISKGTTTQVNNDLDKDDKDNKDNIDVTMPEDEQVISPTLPEFDKIKDLISDKNEIKIDIEEDDNKLSFDDIVTIDDGAYIYTNCYDATYNTNAINPYYDGEYERSVEGIVYELDGKIYVIYDDDANALEKQKELEDKGAVITAVLVRRTDLANEKAYEGYYSANHVRVKSR